MPYIEKERRVEFKISLENIIKYLDSDESYYYVISSIISSLRTGIEDAQIRWIDTTLNYDQRKIFTVHLKKLNSLLKSEGHYNYCITVIVHQYIIHKKLRYVNLNNIIGVLEQICGECTTYHQKGVLRCIISEFYRTVGSHYEDEKIKENGNISELDR